MKSKMLSGSLAIALALSITPLQAQEAADDTAQTTSARVSVALGDFSQMRELKHLFGAPLRTTESHIRSLAKWLEQRAGRIVPEGQTLEVLLRDVDLAGDYEPARGPAGEDIRVVKELYPPRIELHYRLADAAGQVLEEGDATLRDTGFMLGAGGIANDPLRFEKRLLDDWLRGLFPGR